jgi:hypothetical protein
MENAHSSSVSEPPTLGWGEGESQHYDVDTRLAGDDVKEDVRLHPAAAVLYSFPEGDVRVVHKKRKTHTLGPALPVPTPPQSPIYPPPRRPLSRACRAPAT